MTTNETNRAGQLDEDMNTEFMSVYDWSYVHDGRMTKPHAEILEAILDRQCFRRDIKIKMGPCPAPMDPSTPLVKRYPYDLMLEILGSASVADSVIDG